MRGHMQKDMEMKLQIENQKLKQQIHLLEAEVERCHDALSRASERADFDYLTGVYNRNGIVRRIEKLLMPDNEGRSALCFLDLDNFKQINDRFGHSYGDQVLCDVVHTICAQLEKRDIMGRFGGDEFLIFMRDLPEVELLMVRAQNICASIQEKSSKYGLTASIGIACYPVDGASLQELIDRADQALYRSKRDGKNRACRCI